MRGDANVRSNQPDPAALAQSKLTETSADAGWTSALLEVHRCEEVYRDFELAPTPDTHLVVQLKGRHRLEAFRRGNWSGAEYGKGAVGMASGGETDRLRSLTDAPFTVAHLYLPHCILDEAATALREITNRVAVPLLPALKFEDPVIVSTVVTLVRAARSGVADLYAEQAMH